MTGAAGFIASKVCELLLRDGHTVVGVDNLNDYYDIRLKLYRLGRIARQAGMEEAEVVRCGLSVDSWKNSTPATSIQQLTTISQRLIPNNQYPTTNNRFEFRVLDIENLPALEEVFKAHKFEAVFNLAARAGVRYSLEFPDLYRRTNVLGEENVLKCQVKYGVKKHVLASSSSVYAGCPMPFVEDAVLGQMQSPYAETKRQAELLALDYHQKHGIDVTALRYFTVFGPAGRPDMAPFRFIKWIDEGTPITLYGDGSQARDFTYVDDIARGTILAGQLFGGQMSDVGRQPSGAASSAFSFQPSAFAAGQLSGGCPLSDAGCQGSDSDKQQTTDSQQRRSQTAPPKAESGKLKAEGSNPNSDSKLQMSSASSAPSTSDFRFQVSGFAAGQLSGGCPLSDAGCQGSDSDKQQTTDSQQRRSQTAPRFDIINLGGGNNPLSITAMIGIIEEAFSAQRALKAESGKLKAEGSDNTSGLRSQVSGLSDDPQLSSFSIQLSRKALINRLPPSPADMKETWADIGKAKRLLGWSPQITPADGFRRTVDWHSANKEWLKEIKA